MNCAGRPNAGPKLITSAPEVTVKQEADGRTNTVKVTKSEQVHLGRRAAEWQGSESN